MKAITKLLVVVCVLVCSGCAGVNAINSDAQGTVIHTMDTYNLTIPLYHKNF